jgi:tetratricopeptide (TPR) repeat protein
MKKIGTFAFVVLLALGSISCAKLQARDNLQQGIRAFRNAHYEDAINHFKEAIRLDPSLTSAELHLAMAYLQQFIPGAQSEENLKHAEMAVQTFENVLARDPNNVTAIAGLAGIYYNTNEFQKARDYYKKNAELDPQDRVPFYGIGAVNWTIVYNKAAPPPPEEQGQLIEEGLQYLDKALGIDPDYEDAMTYKNLLLREKARLTNDEQERQKLTAEADDWFNKALETRKRVAEKKASGLSLEK